MLRHVACRASRILAAIAALQIATGLISAPLVVADEPPADIVSQPLSPQDSLKTIVVRPGLKVELVVHEPMVVDPVAFAWGADGKFWVVEMNDYPLGLDGRGKPGGRVKYLEDTDGDGRYDRNVVFLDGLQYPTSVLPWRRGVLVCAVPEIFYAEDVDGDGRAERRETLYEGLRVGNPQHLANGLRYGLDGWVHCANGATRTDVKSTKSGKSVDVGTRDFRIRPDTGDIEPLVGRSQYLREMDDWGNWFGSSNSNPLYHFTQEEQYLRRNPHAVYPPAQVDVSVTPGASQVYPISKTVTRFNDLSRANRFTSACSGMIYRDNLLGDEYYGNSFVCEPVHNLIHREVVTYDVSRYYGRRAPGEETSEFLASTDNWFRPSMVRTGPDGALWIADMYRLVIEHPEWIPKEWQAKLDLRAGADRGRIYRVVREGVDVPKIPRLDNLKAVDLARVMESTSGTFRDMAMQRIVEEHTGDEHRTFETGRVVDALIRIVNDSKRATARLHALATLALLDGELDSHVVRKCLTDDHLAVRRWALRCITPGMLALDKELFPAIDKSDHYDFNPRFTCARGPTELGPSARAGIPLRYVEMQRMYALGAVDTPEAWRLLAVSMGRTSYAGPFQAGVSSLNRQNLATITAELVDRHGITSYRLANLIDTALGYDDRAALSDLIRACIEPKKVDDRLDATVALLEGFARHRRTPQQLRKGADAQLLSRLDELQRQIDEARRDAADSDLLVETRILRLKLFGFDAARQADELRILSTLLTPSTPGPLQDAAVAALGRFQDPAVADLLLTRFAELGPFRKSAVLDFCLSRKAWTERLLAAIADKRIPAAEIDVTRAQQLAAHADAAIRKRAGEVLQSSINADRRRIIEQYQAALSATGDATRGREVFAKSCGNCHKIGDVGNPVGPDLAALSDKSPTSLVTSILDPNRAVESKFVAYTAETAAGLTFTGLLIAESSNDVTLALADGKRQTIARGELESFRGTGRSFMPEGVEKDLTPEKLADVLAFIGAVRPTRKTFAGNQPHLVRPEALRGEYYLMGPEAAIYGDTLKFESAFANLGYWQSANDWAEWELEVAKGGEYEVSLEYACAPDCGGTFVVETDGGRLSGAVKPTTGWKDYDFVVVGRLQLQPGRRSVVVRTDGKPKQALFDLKSVRIKPR